ncbi:MAG: peroxisomal biogenesis factor 19 [Acidobacteriia bacterium]|nr:peroxisomal biogenesis factor 19 [Terriglobia bacterium]
MFWLIFFCILISSLTFFYILRPLFSGSPTALIVDSDDQLTSLRKLLRKKEVIYENIKDLDFEFKMGKLSDDDYHRLHEDYLQEAYPVMTQIESIQAEPHEKSGGSKNNVSLKKPKK